MTTLSVQHYSAARAESASCAHCGLPVPADLYRGGRSEQFCCSGCETVFGAIQACGLDRYYALRQQTDVDPQPAAACDRRFDDFDNDAFQTAHCRTLADGLSAVEFVLEGVHCAACLWLIEKIPQILPGVVETRLNLNRKIVRVVWNPQDVQLSDIARRFAAFGYTPHPLDTRSADNVRRAEDRSFLIRIAVAGAIAGNVMLIAFALYGGMFHGIEQQYFHFFRFTSLALAVASLAWPGRTFFRSAWTAVRTRTANMDLPIAIGLAAGTVWSIAATFRGTGEVYFDSVTLLVFLLLVGRWIQLRQQRKSSDAVELLFSMTPRHARRVESGGVREVPISALQSDDLVEVRGGDTIPADGVVFDSSSSIDNAWLTGEHRPQAVRHGDKVCAGATNISARLLIQVEVAGEETKAAQLMRLVEESAHRRAPVVRLADRIAGVFVCAVLFLAASTVCMWWIINPARGVENALALLIITCPCALGLATPLALVSAIGRAAKRGILIKGGEIVESLTGHGGIAFLDKTGTITEGRVAVREWQGDESILPLAAALEKHSAHPVARALVEYAQCEGDQRYDFCNVQSISNGVSGVVGEHSVVVGSEQCLHRQAIEIPNWAVDVSSEMTRQTWSPIFVAVNDEVRAVFGVGDSIRTDAAAAIEELQRLGWTVSILSGDHPDVVAAVGRRFGLDKSKCLGGATPEEKLRIVEDARRSQSVLMVGDGVNDAAALTAATIGVAVKGGAEASLASADVYLNRAGLSDVPELIIGSSRTLRVIRRGLAVSLGYNVIGSTLAIAGLINPLIAAILMPISSLTVVTLAFRSRTFGGRTCR